MIGIRTIKRRRIRIRTMAWTRRRGAGGGVEEDGRREAFRWIRSECKIVGVSKCKSSWASSTIGLVHIKVK